MEVSLRCLVFLEMMADCGTANVASIQGPSWRDIFEWLTSKNDDLDFLPFQQDLLRNRQNGTGEWFFDRAEFQHWLSARSGFLYCHGMRKSTFAVRA